MNDLPFSESDRLAKMIPDEINISLEDAITKSTELRTEIERNPVARRIVDAGRVLEGMVRNTGKHAAGIIITDQPLDDFVPLTSQEGDVTVQFDMAAVGKLGLLKMDFLGLKTLTVLSDAVENVRRTADPKFDLEAISLEDPVTYKLLNSGRTVGVFQLESSGMQNACKLVGISNIDDINAICALYRPGPMQFIPDYARARRPRHGAVSAPAARARAEGDLRHHRLPGAGDGVRQGHRRLYPRRRRHASPRHGKEGRRCHGQGARQIRGGAKKHHDIDEKKATKSSICWISSPTTASTNPTPPRMH